MRNILSRLLALVMLLILVSGQSVSALSNAQRKLFNENINYFDSAVCDGGTGSNSVTPTTSSSAGLVWPFATKSSSQYDRVDQGWDIQSKAGAAIYAIAPGKLHVYLPDPGMFGNDYPVEELDNDIGGPSKFVYYGHVHILQGLEGKHVEAGEKIATANTVDGENGSGAPPGWLEIGFAQPGTDAPVASGSDPSPEGQKMKDLLINTQPGSTGAAAVAANPAQPSDQTGCCPSSGGSTDTSLTGETTGPAKAVQQVVWSTLTGGGIDDMHAAAVMGNIAHEGVWDPESVENVPGLPPRSTDPTVTGPNYGYGLIGWTPGSRLLDSMKEAGISGKPYTAETQAAVILAHIQGKTPSQYSPDIGKQFLNTKTIEAATSAYEGPGGFENPQYPEQSRQQRIDSAKQFLQEYGGTTSSTTGSVSSGSCCPSSGGTGGAPGSVTLTGKDNEEKAFNYFVSQGLTPQQSAGIIGNLMLESGIDPTIVEGGSHSSTPGSGGWGIAQWTPGTKITAIASAAHISGPIDQLLTQLDILWAQLNGKAGSYDESQALKDIKSTTTVEDAVLAFQGNEQVGGHYIGFERPKDEAASVATRTTYAKQALQKYGGGAGASASCSGTSQGPVNIIKHDSFGNADGLMGHRPTMIGLHYTAGNEQNVGDVVNALADPTGAKHCNKNCSVQLTVDPKGNVYQLTSRLDVITENIINFNDADIGIEIMGPNEQALLSNKAQFDAVTALVTQLMQQYNIPMSQDFKKKTGLMGHNECDHWSQGHLGDHFEGIYKNDPAVESTDGHTDPGNDYMSKVRAVVGPALGN